MRSSVKYPSVCLPYSNLIKKTTHLLLQLFADLLLSLSGVFTVNKFLLQILQQLLHRIHFLFQ